MQEQWKLKLVEELSRQSGILLSSVNDCQKLSDWLSAKNLGVSGHTIARLVGILPSRRTYKTTLNLLAEAVGMRSWDHFYRFHMEYEMDSRLSFDSKFTFNSFTFQSIELALAAKNYLALDRITEKIETVSNPKIDHLMRFGYLVRQNQRDQDFLDSILNNHITRSLLLEYFVDEDNPDSYFTNAIWKESKRKQVSESFQFFSESFLTTQYFYQGKGKICTMHEIEASNALHFHILSRNLEASILSKTGTSIEAYGLHLEKLQGYLNECTCRDERSWYLARVIRAFSFKGMIRELMMIKFFEKALSKQFLLIQNDILSTADLIVQFAYYTWQKKMRKNQNLIEPQCMKHLHFNENNTRICVESALLYTLDTEKNNSMLASLKALTKHTGHGWVWNALGV